MPDGRWSRSAAHAGFARAALTFTSPRCVPERICDPVAKSMTLQAQMTMGVY